MFLYSLKYIKPESYLDVTYLGLNSILRVYAGWVHCFKADGGLPSIAKMEQRVYDKYRYPLMLGYRQWGQVDLAVALFKLYTIYFRPQFIPEMIGFEIAFQFGSVLLSLVGVSAEERCGVKGLVPNAPGHKRTVVNLSVTILYIACKMMTSYSQKV